MTNPIIKLVNASTGAEIEREMNAEELAQWQAVQIAEAARKEAESQKASARSALLERLGLTEDEARLLLG